MSDLAAAVLRGEVRAVARLITRLENQSAGVAEDLAALFPHSGRAAILGVTGAPGAGKSTLVDQLAFHLRAAQHCVGIIAVDPSSPFSGGALLGDRVRMQRHMADPGVFIRSMSARGALGGLAAATRAATHVLDAAGYDVVIIETVGVGQSELDIAGAADTVLVVTTPDMGDAVQTLKAGILEIGDIFALNKADLPQAAAVRRALHATVVGRGEAGWQPPIIDTVARSGAGIAALWQSVEAHRMHLQRSDLLARRRAERLRTELLAAVERSLRTETFAAITASAAFSELLRAVQERQLDPFSAASLLVSRLQRLDHP